MKRGGAFTLLELLVAVAIIGVLAALLLSVLGSVKERSQATQCLSNLRQLATANLTYATENDGRFVPAQDVKNFRRWHGERRANGGTFDPSRGPLARYLGAEGRVKLCPTFKDALGGAQSFEEGAGGYGYNAAYIGGMPSDYYLGERMTNVLRSAQTVMFTDTAFARAGGIQEYAFCEPFQYVDAEGRLIGALSASVHFLHRGHANVAWCDGHASAEPPSQIDGSNYYGGDASKWQIGWFGPSDENGYWNPRREPQVRAYP